MWQERKTLWEFPILTINLLFDNCSILVNDVWDVYGEVNILFSFLFFELSGQQNVDAVIFRNFYWSFLFILYRY
jgi:hypothetical protein